MAVFTHIHTLYTTTTTAKTKDDTDSAPAAEESKTTSSSEDSSVSEEKPNGGSKEGGNVANGEATPEEKQEAETKAQTKRGKEKKTRERDKAKDKDDKDKDKEEKKDREKRSERRDKDRSKSSSSKSSSDKDKERDKSKDSRSDRHRSSRDKDKRDKDRKSSSSSSSRKSSSKDKDHKDRDKKDKEKDKEKEKEKEKEKKRQESEDKATLEKVKPLPVDGLAKIPRKSAPPTFLDALGSADADMKPSRKPSSVKTYKSRGFRNTGLLDEPALPPKKTGEKKPGTNTTPATAALKRAPSEDLSLTPPDKRVRSSVSSQPLNADKPGGVKLISPKRPSLSDDGGFMAALTAAGTERKKVTRKRKSSESENKDTPPKGEEDGSTSPTTPTTPTKEEKEKAGMMSPTNVRPTFNFYQETLKSDDEKGEGEEGKKEESEENEEDMEAKEEGDEESKMDVDNSERDESEPMDAEGGDDDALKDEDIPLAPAVPAPAQEEYEKVEVTFSAPDPGTVRGVLVYHRPSDRRRKTVKWRAEDDLQEVFYFELDETERVNVNTVKFNELMAMEKQREREMMGKGRGLGRLDLMNKGVGGHHMPGRMESVTTFMRWSLLPVMLTGQPNVAVGGRSQEKHTQAARQTSTMPAFFHPSTLPETPKEPDPEMVVRAEPKEIPLNDVLGQDNLHDHRDKFWPEPLMSEPPPYPPYPMAGGMPGGAPRGGGSHWVIGGGGPPAPAYGGGPMYGASGPMPVGPGGPPGGPCGYGGPGGYGGDMGPEGMDGWGGPVPEYPGQNMMMMGGGQNVMMGGHPSMGGPRNMMPNMGMGGGPRFRGRQGGNWNNSGRPPPVCRHFMNGHCKHGKSCKYLHPSPH